MSKLTIYDTKRKEFSPPEAPNEQREYLEQAFFADIRLAVRQRRGTRLTVYFRAKETPNSRPDQFLAEYTIDQEDNPFLSLKSELIARVEDEWGYTIDESHKDMAVFRQLDMSAGSLPGSDADHRILEHLSRGAGHTSVGVSDPSAAVSLIKQYTGTYSNIAITESGNNNELEQFDLVVATGSYNGIEPLGDTENKWNKAQRSLREELIGEEIQSIKASINTLSRKYELSNSEIRNRIQRQIPALSTQSTQSSRLQDTGSSDDHLIPTSILKGVIAVSVVLVIIIGGVYGAQFFLGGSFFGGGGDTVQIQGTVYADDAGEQPLSGANVTINGESLDSPVTNQTDSSGQFAFDVPNGTYTVEPANESYDPREVSGEQTEVNFYPTIVEGTITNAQTGEPIEDAETVLLDGDTQIDNATGSVFSFPRADVGYTIQVSAPEFETQEREVDETALDESQTIELAPETFSVNGTVTNQSDEPVSGATVRLRNTETSASTGDTGKFSTTDVTAGDYVLTVEADGYTTQTQNISVDEDLGPVNIEISQETTDSSNTTSTQNMIQVYNPSITHR